jgi:autotransporter-associated beta strand protein
LWSSGGTFDIQGFNQTLAGVQITSGNITGSGGTLTSTSAFDLQNGTVSAILGGSVGLNKTTANTVTLTGNNTYSGVTTISAGTLSVSLLANGVVASNIGNSSNASTSLILNGGTLQYTGAAVSTDRLFSLQTSSTIDASGTGR